MHAILNTNSISFEYRIVSSRQRALNFLEASTVGEADKLDMMLADDFGNPDD